MSNAEQQVYQFPSSVIYFCFGTYFISITLFRFGTAMISLGWIRIRIHEGKSTRIGKSEVLCLETSSLMINK
jgi:hypothetical protein